MSCHVLSLLETNLAACMSAGLRMTADWTPLDGQSPTQGSNVLLSHDHALEPPSLPPPRSAGCKCCQQQHSSASRWLSNIALQILCHPTLYACCRIIMIMIMPHASESKSKTCTFPILFSFFDSIMAKGVAGRSMHVDVDAMAILSTC